MRFIIHQFNNQGVSLVIGVVIMSLILTTALAISSIFFGEIRNSRIFEKSTQAFYAADSGAEAILYNQRKNPSPLSGSSFTCDQVGPVLFDDPALGCVIEITGGSLFRITGQYNTTEAQRRVEVSY